MFGVVRRCLRLVLKRKMVGLDQPIITRCAKKKKEILFLYLPDIVARGACQFPEKIPVRHNGPLSLKMREACVLRCIPNYLLQNQISTLKTQLKILCTRMSIHSA